MTRLFGRDWRVQVGRLVVERPLRVAFEVERTVRPNPNTATVRLYNLNETSQGLIREAGEALVVVEAGYVDGRAEIFRGTVLRARAGGRGGKGAPVGTEREKVEVVTVVEATDGGTAYRQARVARSYQPGVAITTVLRDCAAALGVGEGNLRQVEALAALEGGQTTYPEGTVLSGQASRELTRILASYGLRWSVQHGAIQVVRRGGALQSQAVRLAAATGLIGRPEVGPRGRVTARALLAPDLWPGRRVRLESRSAEGTYTVRSIRAEGDSHADLWQATCELEPEEAP